MRVLEAVLSKELMMLLVTVLEHSLIFEPKSDSELDGHINSPPTPQLGGLNISLSAVDFHE